VRCGNFEPPFAVERWSRLFEDSDLGGFLVETRLVRSFELRRHGCSVERSQSSVPERRIRRTQSAVDEQSLPEERI
jgi:hypothetical protein